MEAGQGRSAARWRSGRDGGGGASGCHAPGQRSESGAACWRRDDARQREKGGRPGNEEETAGTATAEAALNRPAQEQKSCCDDCLGDSRASGGHTESHCASSSNIGSSRSSRNCKDLLQPLTSGWASQSPPATASQGGWPLWLATVAGQGGWPLWLATVAGHCGCPL